MKKFFYKSSVLALMAGIFLTSCDPEIDTPSSSAGELNLTKYVAVGNSLTAGFADGGLYRSGQLNSYPAIMAEQFKLVGGGEFTQPLFTEAQRNGSGYLRLTGFTAAGLPILTPVTSELAVRGMGQDGRTLLYTKFAQPVQNLGVPGIRMENVTTAGYGWNNPLGFNPYFERLLPDAPVPPKSGALTPYVDLVAASNPTFFTMWLGNNDVLGYATSGGQGNITTEANFKTNLDAMMTALLKTGVKGMVINIPDVTGIPYFTTKATASLRQMAAAANAKLYITTGTGTVREATNDDFVLLPSTVGTPEQVGTMTIPHGFSPFNALANSEVLDKDEAAKVKLATQQFNQALAAKASANVGLVDMNAFFNSVQMKEGKPQLSINAVAYSPAFITGNLFSLDGVHLTPRGYAIVANKIIDDINKKFNSRIPKADETKFRTVQFPVN
ncbi:G-D-S-L family lipolytic protein [Pontibacter sp. JH31]|uniref:G-D-S-L family lipolytic protein n=1 Tax=Pontibacter aquaedesilientis TaxID=2766980 RepID=A0ABR7XG68_9BACT|nr:SGNH/GDSL hydrolase family protein [Pontibacter aquaedesilientis]MBD1397293.1 G-D-S-L family lipolytic protein [Pontibacter aquaedesilientis]